MACPRRRTGSGKTRVLETLANHIDLEGLARHRGSAFGARAQPQPTPIAFENDLAAACLRCPAGTAVAIEDESRTIGRLAVPETLFEAMQAAPIVLLETAMETRVAHIFDEYVRQDPDACRRLPPALDRIRKRLGGERHATLTKLMTGAFEHGDEAQHHAWIERLLQWYYDPMYDYQMERKRDRIVFKGDFDAVRDYLSSGA